jgi:N-acetylmuramoyl-L-alanine amidase
MLHQFITSMATVRRTITILLLASAALLSTVGSAAAFSTVVIDAGHGGHDRGGIPGQRLSEKTYTLDIAKRVAGILRDNGLRVVMTRNYDWFVSLPDRVATANRQKNAVFVSIHLNSGIRPGAQGFETYYCRGRQSAALAGAIHKRIGKVSPFDNRGIRSRSYYVLRNTRIPAVLTESGFLTNREEGRLLTSSAYRQKIARAIAAGILDRR